VINSTAFGCSISRQFVTAAFTDLERSVPNFKKPVQDKRPEEAGPHAAQTAARPDPQGKRFP